MNSKKFYSLLRYACMRTFSTTPTYKLIENHRGIAFIKVLSNVIVQGG